MKKFPSKLYSFLSQPIAKTAPMGHNCFNNKWITVVELDDFIKSVTILLDEAE